MRVSVIIPVLNEEAAIGETLRRLVADQQPDEVLVVDGGSQDQTVQAIARSPVNAKLVLSGQGRARQMNEGARQAKGEILLFLHADTRLPAGAIAKIRALVGGQRALGGKFRSRFEPDSMRLRLLALYTRYQFFSYGDHAFWMRRDIFDRLKGYREDVPFEDYDFYRRMRKLIRPHIIKTPVITSSRRFLAMGVGKQNWINFFLVSAHALGLNVRPWKKRLYKDVRE